MKRVMRMEWQQLEYFRVVAKTEHFRKAAEILSISQPALSRSMTKLEEELGTPLFDRTGRSVKLNKFGQLFLRRVENGLNEIAIGVEELNQLKNPYTGTVSIAFLQILGIKIVPDMIRDFNEKYPDVEIRLYQNNIIASMEQLLSREVDLCLIPQIKDTAKIMWHKLFDEELFLYVPAHHPLAGRDSVALSELSQENFIAFKRGLGMRDVIDGFCEQTGFMPRIRFEGEDVPTLAGLVSAGLGVTIIPAFHGVSSDRVKQVSISQPYCHRTIGIAWLNNTTLPPSVGLFRNHVIGMYSK
ncbi:LysR family transcriptional regulator [Bacillus benzoevorans]|uniref:DNA-binding transcriptional LysR family regulator n=1 Tax=Bacillus benzoevorans TaxID=1456 RepID=A0A7X0LWW5_9BACI|nr:LysR family transcriptional regulator [Bacillus benzoevorans]MBB6446995.1 DNA-binding transcriptional LysR family regulator [Bacillus benzoevorans]